MLMQRIGTLEMQDLKRPEPVVSRPTPATEPTQERRVERGKPERGDPTLREPQVEDEALISTLEQGEEAQPAPPEGTEAIQKQAQERLTKLVEQANAKLSEDLALRFRTDEETGIDYFQIIEKQTGDIIRQYPPDEILNLVERLREMQGLIVSQEA